MSRVATAQAVLRDAARPHWRRIPTARWGLRAVACLYLGLMILLPLVAVVGQGFAHGFASLSTALSQPGAVAALKLTIGGALIVAVINALFGTLLAWVLVRYSLRGHFLLGALVDLPFAVPTLVTGVMLVALYGPNSPVGALLERHGIHVIFAPLGIVVALLFVSLPFVVRTVQPVLLELDRNEEDAARVLGAGRVMTFLRVVLPHLRPAIVAGALLVFARSVGEFGAIVIVAGNITGRTLTAPVYIYQLTSQFRYPEAAALSTVLFALSFLLVLITDRLVNHWGPRL
jgi:sulfate/thiosulfate transport system permease protein